MLLAELNKQKHSWKSVSRYRFASETRSNLTPYLLDLSDRLLACVVSQHPDDCARLSERLGKLPLPDTLEEFRINDQTENTIAKHFLDCLNYCIENNRITELKTLLRVDMLLRTVILDRHGYASVAPQGTEAEGLILTGLTFTEAKPEIHAQRCRSVISRYHQTSITDHRMIGNLCYEARAIARATPRYPSNSQEAKALRDTTKMLIVMGFDGSKGDTSIEMLGGLATLAALCEDTNLPIQSSSVVSALCDRGSEISNNANRINIRIPLPHTSETANIDYQAYLTRLEVRHLSDTEITRLLAERVNANSHACLHRNPTRSSKDEKVIAMKTLTNHLKTSPITEQEPQKVHIIYSFDDDIERLTTQDDDAWMAVSEGHTVETSVPIEEVVDQLHDYDWTQFSGDSWRILRNGVESYLASRQPGNESIDHHSPIYDNAPKTLPPELALGRLDIINEYGSLADLRVKRALTEIVVSARENRALETGFMCNRSCSNDEWETEEVMDFDNILSRHIEVDAQLQQIKASELSENRDTKQSKAILEQHLRELDHHLDELGETETENLRLG
ncbi:hypothetical protein [Marinobacter subterrani]|uniref:hypothetical protein n=1 Tax=Marinobacter subterrani TaxID=1658765 RepID=UPI0023539366|nr:hypothetical protein [Marinobacter subterrani]